MAHAKLSIEARGERWHVVFPRGRRVPGQPAEGFASPADAAAWVAELHATRAAGRRPRFRAVVVRRRRDFHRGSFRLVEAGTHRVRVGCVVGAWDREARRCRRELEVQAVLHPVTEGVPCSECFRLRMFGL